MCETPIGCHTPRRCNRFIDSAALIDCTNKTNQREHSPSFSIEVPTTPSRKRTLASSHFQTPTKRIKYELGELQEEKTDLYPNFPAQSKENKKPKLPTTPQTPKTPKRTIQIVTPKSLNRTCNPVPFATRLLQSTPHRQLFPPTPSTPSTPSYNSTAKLSLRKSYRSAGVVGRENEKSIVESFFRQHLDANAGGALYVSGAPGTGKTVLLHNVLDHVVSDYPKVNVCYINCMTINEPKAIFEKIHSKIVKEEILENEDHHINFQCELESHFTQSANELYKPVIIVLDEMDHLIAREQQVLYTLFEWPSRPTSRLILVGIANALDMTDRFLPRLRTKHITPKLLSFTPYTAQEISTIIKARLKTAATTSEKNNPFTPIKSISEVSDDSINVVSQHADETPFIHPAAIELCARKVAASSGDLRKALDICRHAIELAEREWKAQHDNTLSSVDIPRASIAHVVRATSAMSQSASARLKNLGLQQKAILCTLVVCEKTSLSVADVFEKYSSLCLRDRLIYPLTSSEFCDVANSLETLSIIRLRTKQRNGKPQDRIISLLVPEMDVITAVGDIGTLKRFFDRR